MIDFEVSHLSQVVLGHKWQLAHNSFVHANSQTPDVSRIAVDLRISVEQLRRLVLTRTLGQSLDI